MSTAMLFASLELERDLPKLTDLPAFFSSWFEDAGLIAALALLIWGLSYLLTYLFEGRPAPNKKFSLFGIFFIGAMILSALGYIGFVVLLTIQGLVPETIEADFKTIKTFNLTPQQHTLLAVGGGFALLAAIIPMIARLIGRIRWQRIAAIARLSVKESIRGRVIWVFGVMLLIFLFASFFVSYKPEDQIRNYVSVIFTPMTILFLVAAALIGSFSIPVDVTRQTIHTIVTKPVERYEIVLGRFLGHGFMLSVALMLLTGLSLIYVVRGVNPIAAKESFTARVPVFADALRFHGTQRPDQGENVGREWTYRSYIRGKLPGTAEGRQFAIWHFDALPSYLADRQKPVRVEFTFDIFRTTKGIEDLGVLCNLYFVDGKFDVEQMNKQLKARQTEREKESEKIEKKYAEAEKEQAYNKLDESLAGKYGIYGPRPVYVTDYHTQSLDIPVALFKHLQQVQQENASQGNGEKNPTLKVLVTIANDIASQQQMVGMARRDLYLLATERPFWQNFAKGMIGLWCNTMLILAVAVACSTYFSAIISLLATLFFLGAGTIVEFIRSLALGTTAGGGPFESANRMFKRLPPSAPLEENTATTVVTNVDAAYRIFLNFVLKFIPDIHRFNLTEFVAEGFDISWLNVIFLDNILFLLAYLVPWAILAFYLMNSREVANPS